MKSRKFENPKLYNIATKELSLSGAALLDVMQGVLSKGVPFRFCARGWSMMPFIKDRDVITVSPYLCDRPRVGEVVAYICPQTGKLVVHRIISRQGSGVSIRGDGIGTADIDTIAVNDLMGRVTRIERNGHPVKLGLGIERRIIAAFSRMGMLIHMRLWISKIRNFKLRRIER